MIRYWCVPSVLRKPLCAGVVLITFAAVAHAQAPVSAGQRVPSRITQPLNESNRTTLRGNTHPLARPQFDRGAVADSQPIRRMLLLLQRSPDQDSALRGLLDQQQSKSSPNFHQWLTPQQFGQQFGPSDADLQTVTTWLQSHGFQVNRVSSGRTVVEFSGTAGQVRGAFNTEIHRFVVNGEAHFANATDPQVPSALAGVVAGPVSLHDFPLKAYSHSRGTFSRDRETGQVKPLLTGSSNGTAFFALGPADFAKIYNVPAASNGNPNGGQGQSIAIIGDSEVCTKNSAVFSACSSDDVVAFRNLFGLPVNAPTCPAGSLNNGGPICVVVDGTDPGLNGDEIEGDLDTQWAGAVAPNATIDFVIAQDTEATFGTDLAAEYVIDNNLASVMSESFGACEAALGSTANAFEYALWEQATAQGITPVVSAGDSGSAGCDDPNASAPNAASFGNEVNGIASTPFTVATGGTDFDTAVAGYPGTFWNTGSNANNSTTGESAKSYIPEIPWNDSCAQSLSSPPVATGCNPPSNTNLVQTVGGGGGRSNCIVPVFNNAGQFTGCQTSGGLTGYPKPAWQSGTGIADGVRDLPDVSLFAAAGFRSNSFYVVCEADLGGSCIGANAPFIGVGGTSSSAPTFAGVMALVVKSQNARQGNANYALYALAANQTATPPSGGCNSTSSPNTASCTFYDITIGNNSVPCAAGSLDCPAVGGSSNFGIVENPLGTIAFSAGAGYDLATGLGTLNVGNLIGNWSSVVGTFQATTTTLCLVAAPASGTSCSNPPAAFTITHGATVNGQVMVASGGSAIAVSNSASKPETVSLLGSGGNLQGGTGGVNVFTANGTDTSADYTVSNVDVEPLTNGVTSFSTKGLIGGTSYSVSANYPGDGTFGASSSAAVVVTVNPEPSRTTPSGELLNINTGALANLSNATVFYGDALILRADVVGVSSGLQNGTGTVVFKDGASTLGTFGLNNQGYTEDQTAVSVDGVTESPLAVGSHSISISYNGDSSYCATSNTNGTCVGTTVAGPLNFTVSKAPTTAAFLASSGSTSSSTSITVSKGATVTLSATVDTASSSASSSGGSMGAKLTGTVTFSSPTHSTVPLSLPHPSMPNWIGAWIGAALGFLFLLFRRVPLRRHWGTAVTTILLMAAVGISVSCSHAGTSNGGSAGGTALGSVSPTAATDSGGFVEGKASLTIQPAATETVTATYSGDGNYQGSTSSTITINVQ